MAHEIDMFEMIDFEIPAGKDKKITVSVPPFDCFDPKDVENINKQLKTIEESEDQLDDVVNPLKNGSALVRFMLKYFNTSKDKQTAIDKLVPRQLNAIDEVWGSHSNMTIDGNDVITSGDALGESETSTDESSENEE